MGRRGGKQRSPRCETRPFGQSHAGRFEPWQSAQQNELTYQYYVDIILKMALSRFKWVNLPSTCDERYLELMLVTHGMASIAFPKGHDGMFLSLQAMMQGQPNMYANPSRWLCIGSNGTKFAASHSNGVVVYDNTTRFPLMAGITQYANELTHIRMTKRMNRMHQQVPFILTGPQEKKQDMVNMFKQVAGGEPAILASDAISAINYDAMSTGVKYIGEELAQDEANVWNRIYMMLGSENSTFKQERQTEDEIRAQQSPAALVRMSSLSERRKAADALNARFGAYLDAPIQVVWNRDNESENWNLMHSMTDQLKAVVS